MRQLFFVILIAVSAAGGADPMHTGIAPPPRIPAMPDTSLVPRGTPVNTSAIPRGVRRAVVADAARRFNLPLSAVVLVRAEQIAWPDASLGCPEPGRRYAQVLVPGYRVAAKTVSGEFIYHTDVQGSVLVCGPNR